MKTTAVLKPILVISWLFFITTGNAQTKKIKRPNSRVGISSVDNFVRESFDIYDKVYMYDGYAQQGKPLDDNDIDVLEDALTDLEGLSTSAPDIISDIDGIGALKQAKATLQINRAKKALKYSIKTTKALLTDEKNDQDDNSSIANKNASKDTQDENTLNTKTKETNKIATRVSDNLEVYSKFDFVPGDELIFFDNFANDFFGDFPSKWNTNGSGELLKFDKVDGKWLKIGSSYNASTMPLIKGDFPEDFTIEFDVILSGIDKNTSSNSRLKLELDDTAEFKSGSNYAYTRIPLAQYIAIGIDVKSVKNKKSFIQNRVDADLRNTMLNKPHISIAVNKERFRLWINQTKYLDIPKMLVANSIKAFKISVVGLKNEKEAISISNIKIAKGGVDLRRKLMAEGKISTNGILFNSGSANILPQSLGILKQISQVLMQDDTIKLQIVGHTDADGNDDANLKLSKERANAVKYALTSIYTISANRLTTQGKGETEPVADNSTPEGKAKNRRVEFIKQ